MGSESEEDRPKLSDCDSKALQEELNCRWESFRAELLKAGEGKEESSPPSPSPPPSPAPPTKRTATSPMPVDKDQVPNPSNPERRPVKMRKRMVSLGPLF